VARPRCLLAALALGFTTLAHADAADRYTAVNASRVPNADFQGLAPGADVRTKDNQVAFAFARLALDRATIDFGLDYQYTRYQYNDVDSRNRDLHRVQLPIWLSAPGDRWLLRAHIAPGIFTSSNVLGDFFNRGSSDDLYVTGRLELTRIDARTAWLIGVAHDRAFGESLTYPVVGVLLSPSETVDIRLAWPDPAIDVALTDRHSLSLRVFPAGNQWHVRTDDFSRDFDYRFEAWRSQLNWKVELPRSISIDVSIGYEFGRSHHWTDDPGNRLDATAGSQWLYAIGLRFGGGPLPLTHGYHLNR
jgi:hypothetical protein